MILPIVPLPKDGQAPPDMLTSRLAAVSEVMLLGSGDEADGSGAELAAGCKTFLSECGCRVGPFDVLSGDQEAKVRVRCPTGGGGVGVVVVVVHSIALHCDGSCNRWGRRGDCCATAVCWYFHLQSVFCWKEHGRRSAV